MSEARKRPERAEPRTFNKRPRPARSSMAGMPIATGTSILPEQAVCGNDAGKGAWVIKLGASGYKKDSAEQEAHKSAKPGE